MNGKRFIHSLKLANFLSFGPGGTEIELEPLNVLIGPNASGKSNFVEAIALLRALPRDLGPPIRSAGGVDELMWKGGGTDGIAGIEAVVSFVAPPLPGPPLALRYSLALGRAGQSHQVAAEVIGPKGSSDVVHVPSSYYESEAGSGATANAMDRLEGHPPEAAVWKERRIRQEELSLGQSVLSQLKDPVAYPAITCLARQFGAMKLYREWHLGPHSAVRKPCAADDPKEFLLEDASNLGMVLNDLQNRPDAWQDLLAKLKRFHERADNVTLNVLGNTIEIRLHERGHGKPIPATRLSDGTLRYLCLLAILCHPEPPPLVVIEEPELGLHPDALGAVAELLIEASQRMQIIVTTHSDLLVSELDEIPEALIVCERDDDGTHLRRLSKERLKEWLEKYSLGELWLMGEIGGTS